MSFILNDLGGAGFVTTGGKTSIAFGVPINEIGLAAQTLTPGLVADAETFYSSNLVGGSRFLTPALVTDADVISAPTVAGVSFPASYSDSETFYTPTIVALVGPSYVNRGTIANTFLSDVGPIGLPTGRVNGNLLIAWVTGSIYVSPAAPATTWSTGWQPLMLATDTTLDFHDMTAAAAYRFVDGTETAPTCSNFKSGGVSNAVVLQFSNARATGNSFAIDYDDSLHTHDQHLSVAGINNKKLNSLTIGIYSIDDQNLPTVTAAGFTAETTWQTFNSGIYQSCGLLTKPLGSVGTASGSVAVDWTDHTTSGMLTLFELISVATNVEPSCVIDKESPAIVSPSQTPPAPSLVVDADAFHAPTVIPPSAILTPAFYVDTDAFYVPLVRSIITLVPNLYADPETFYAPIISGQISITPSFYTDTDVFFAPALPVFIIPGFYTDADVFFAPVITFTSIITPNLFTDADAFFVPNVIQFTGRLLQPTRYVDTDVFPSFVTTTSLFPIWYRETDSIHPSSLSASVPLLPPVFNAVDTFYVPRIGQAFLFPALVADVDAIRVTTVNYSSPVLKPPFINADVVINPAVVTRYKTLSPPLLNDADIFRVPNILRGSVTLRPSRVIDPDIFRSPIVGILQVTDNPPGGDPANLPGNLKYVSSYTMAQSGLILSMDLRSSAAKTVNTRMVVYRTSAGLPGPMAGVTVDKTSVINGINNYTLIAPVSVLAGDSIWMGLHSDGNFNWFLSNAKDGSRWNTDTWVGGASDPFGPVNNDNKKAPIVVYYLAASNAAFTVDTVIDLDAFYAPMLVSSKILNPSLITDEFFYTPLVRSQWTLVPDLVTEIDTFYAPALTTKTVLQPARVASDDAVYSPFLAKFTPTVFSAAMPHDDTIYSPTVVDFGAILFPQHVVDTDLLYLPQRSGSIGMTPLLVALGDVFYTPVLSKGAVAIAPLVVDSEIDFYLPVVNQFGGAKMIRPDPFIDQDVFYPPRKSGNAGWRRQIYITGTEADEISIVGTVPVPELVE